MDVRPIPHRVRKHERTRPLHESSNDFHAHKVPKHDLDKDESRLERGSPWGSSDDGKVERNEKVQRPDTVLDDIAPKVSANRSKSKGNLIDRVDTLFDAGRGVGGTPGFKDRGTHKKKQK